ncbi:MAG: hypothetical protein A2288_03345 [Candidatus Moranbacteria bacterium RIFOXYA12_FULL_44_15]|nr:MAG: hypothetical protein A2288_03345 [Candidatus Moranbacteria bacterium RIFOXYA12_FULL_44_15]OGI34946.1 MAG: hypothetical protein A2259_03725 [Candidatus Moranbacteria bacterium RIFOXYA2_FULL_43_15]
MAYHNFSSAEEKAAANNYSANNGDTIQLSNDVSITVNKKTPTENVPTETPTETAPIEPVKTVADCPAEVVNLANWKQTLPIGDSKKPKEIFQPALADYSLDPYFRVDSAGDKIICRAPVNGVTTSNSGYPRSELREMINGGKDQASWSTSSGTHTMTIEQAITAVPETKKHVVAGQIHGSDDDIIAIRLEYPKLFVDINGKAGPTLDANYILGKKFTVKLAAADGQIKVYYNGNATPVHTLKKKASGCYFKAGAYTQSNCSKEKNCSDSNFGEVAIYDLSVDHS